jgi:hypothetical protein
MLCSIKSKVIYTSIATPIIMSLIAPWEILPLGNFITLFALIFLSFMISKFTISEFRLKGWKMFKSWQNSLIFVILLILLGGMFWLAVAIFKELI